jgi:60 kDa SS-A/Ro ribonucleoprotein
MAKMNISQFDTRSAKRSLRTPVSTPIHERGQVLNSTGGYVWEVNDWDRLTRFLILGSEGGTYYVGEHDLTKGNHDCIQRCLKEDGLRVVKTIVDISTQGRAYRNEPALFALALAAASTPDIRLAAKQAITKVARTGTHMYHFTDYLSKLRGGGRGLRNTLSDWFTSKTADQLAYQMVKYQQRDGWSGRDLLRYAHPEATSPAMEAVFRWMVSGADGLDARTIKRNVRGAMVEKSYESVREHLPKFIDAFERAKKADEKTLVKLITEHNLPREAVPTEKLNSGAVWEALLQKMPLTALIRNLGKMTAIGLVRPLTAATKLVTEKLADGDYLRKSRVHPLQVLVALKIYEQGHGDKGSLTWTPVPAVKTALDRAFYLTFGNVKPCGKPVLIGLDVSASMGSSVAGATPLRACEATAALSLVHANVEPECHVMAFNNKVHEIGICAGMRLAEATRLAQEGCGNGTDISQAVQYAIDRKLSVGGFLVMTDNEVNTGRHPAQAAKEYRQRFVPDARSIMLATTSTPFTCNDPNDRYGLDVVGFDTSVPSVISDFIRGGETAPVEADEEAVE